MKKRELNGVQAYIAVLFVAIAGIFTGLWLGQSIADYLVPVIEYDVLECLEVSRD